MKTVSPSAIDIADHIRQQVRAGQLVPGQTLAPVRELAAQLGVNRNTVAAAYRRLAQAGVVEARGRHGTVVRDEPTPGEREGELPALPAGIDLASGNPDPAHLPDLRLLLAQAPAADAPLLYGAATVDAGLAALAQEWCAPDCPAPCAIDLTHGAVDAVERLASAALAPGDAVAVEDPCFLGTINALRLSGHPAVGVAVDAEGMVPAALAQALAAGAQAVLITPRAHNPTGCSLSPARAQALQAVLAPYPHVLVIVDDHAALLAQSPYASPIAPTSERWALVRTLAKALGPDLRLAVVASDPLTSARLRTRLAPGQSWVSHLLQAIASEGLRSPATRQQIEQARQHYAARNRCLRQALQAVGIATPAKTDGFNLWLPVAVEASALVAALAQRGWLVRDGSAFAVQAPTNAIRITVSTLTEVQTTRFAQDLCACLSSLEQAPTPPSSVA